MKQFWWMMRFVKPYKWAARLNILFNIFCVIFSVISIPLVIPLLNDLLSPGMPPVIAKPTFSLSTNGIKLYSQYVISNSIHTHGKQTTLIYLVLIIVALFFLKNLFRYLGMFAIAVVRNGISMDIRKTLYNKLLNLPLSFYSNERKGDIMARMTNDVAEIEWSILMSIEAVFREPLQIIASVLMLIAFSPELTLFVFIMLPIAAILIGTTGRTLKKTSQKGQQKIGILLSFIEETISGLRIIKGFTAERFAQRKFDEMNNEYGKLANKMYRRRDLASPLSEFLGIIIFSIITWYGGQLVFENKLTIGTFIAFLMLFYTIIAPAKAFSSAYYNVLKGVASVERIRVILDAPVTITNPEKPVSIDGFKDHILYKNVSFAYHKGDNGWAVKDVNLRIERGKTIALVGQSGSGKSTLADLLPRFYDVTEGSILLDGQDIRNLTLDDLRNQIGVVTQESILFNESVHNNIAFGLEHKTNEEVVQAAKIANAHEFIMQLPQGYATNIGDRGNKLSGGQRQRLCIARAILKNPPILILDEATSALDTESEKLVQEALNNLMKNRTSIIIAHRLSTILHADEILVMQKGEIVERGNHEQLLNQNGVYKKLYDLQGF